MGETIEAINSEERARVQFLAIKAKRAANSIRVSTERPSSSKRRGTRRAGFSITSRQLIYSPVALGDLVRRQLLANATYQAIDRPATVHVKRRQGAHARGPTDAIENDSPLTSTPNFVLFSLSSNKSTHPTEI